MNIDNARRWWPRLLPLLAATIAVGTDTWVVAGFLPTLAVDMGVSTATAGLSVTVFAASYALAAPVLAAVTSSARPRTVIAVAMLVLALANVVCAVSADFVLFLAGRVLAGLAASVVTPAAGVLAARVADQRRRGRALALVIAGLTIATALGVPVGHVLATTTSWRGALFSIAGLAVVAATLIHTTAPNPAAGSPQRITDRLVPLTKTRALSILALTMLGMAAAYVPYAYIAQLTPAGHSGWFVAILTAYGIGAFVGSLASGSLTDKLGPTRTLTIAYALMAAAFLALACHPPAVLLVLAAATWGAASWAQTPPQQHRLLDAMPTIGSVAIGTNASALYVGIAVGNSLGAFLFSAGTAVMCLVAAAGALAALLWNRRLSPGFRDAVVR